MLDTRGSILAAGILHAAFNATMSMTIFHGSWQALAAMILLTLATAAARTLRPRTRSASPEPQWEDAG